MNGVVDLIYLTLYSIIQSFVLLFVPRRFKQKKSIKESRILITGAGSGVGRQLAIEFSQHSVCLILVDINRKSLLDTEKLLHRQSTVFIYDCDLSDRKKVYEMANKVKKDVGDVDILVNNAGIVNGKYLLDLPDENIVKTMEVNALSHIWLCKSFLPEMMERNCGHIVSIASLAGRTVSPKLTDYCASKFAAIGFAECLEMELRERKLDGIKVTIVCPSFINTGLFAGIKITLGSPMTPEYVAREIVAGVLEEKEIIYLPHFFTYLMMTQQLLPRWFLIKIYELTGNIEMMANFTGRTSEDNRLKSKDIS